MGAGRSPASRAGGGGRSAAIPPQQVTPPTPQQVAQGNVLPNGGVAYDEFLKMSDDDKAALGIEDAPSIQYGKLKIKPTRIGSGKIRVTAVAGGSEVGGGDKVGGMEVTQEISLVSRSFKSSNGGWL